MPRPSSTVDTPPVVTPLVSVVIPVYNTADFLLEAVQSVLSQTYAHLSLVVVDDGSEVEIAALLRHFTDSRMCVVRRTNGGASAARNVGWMAVPDAEYVAFLDADDAWDSQKLRHQVAVLESDESCAGVGCLMRYVSSSGAVLGVAGQTVSEKDQRRIADGELQPFQLSSLLIRRSALEEIGGFDEALGLNGLQAEDLDLMARLAPLGRIHTLPVVLGSYRVHPASAMARHRRQINRAARFVRRRVQARRRGEDLTWEAFAATERTTWGERRQDIVEQYYRSAALWHAERRPLRALRYGMLATAVDPVYTVRRLYRQRFASRAASAAGPGL
jgi:glycosyltransferase involved in cell wall biosynthesis